MKKRNYSLIIGLILTGIILIITIIGQFWTPYAVTGMDSHGQESGAKSDSSDGNR